MNDGRPNPGPSAGGPADQGLRGGSGWSDVTLCALLVLAVAVPTMAIEEDWHGSPMIDQPSHLWIVAAALVAGAFLVGRGTGRAPASLGQRLRTPPRRPPWPLPCSSGRPTLRRLWFVHEGVPERCGPAVVLRGVRGPGAQCGGVAARSLAHDRGALNAGSALEVVGSRVPGLVETDLACARNAESHEPAEALVLDGPGEVTPLASRSVTVASMSSHIR